MTAQSYLVATRAHARSLIARVGQMTVGQGHEWLVTFERIDLSRSPGQNKRLRTIEREISEISGHDVGELHEILLARKYGTELLDLGNGKTMERPARRTSDMGVAEIEEYTDWVISIGITEFEVEFSR